MTESLLQEYKAYYAARANRYADNPDYVNTYRAEMKLSDAMQSCAVLDEFKTKIGNLNDLCAVSLMKDEMILEKKFFEKHQESIRVKASEKILENIDALSEVMALISMVNEVMNKNMIEISIDEAHRQLMYDWDLIDEAHIYANAVVPDNYKNKMQQLSGDLKKSVKENLAKLTENMHAWQADWKIKPELNLEYRHRRLIPFNGDIIKDQIEKYRNILNS